MATKTRKKWRRWAPQESIKNGPNLKKILEAVCAKAEGKEPEICEFGTTKTFCKMFPLSLTGLILRKNGQVDIFGEFHIPENKVFNGRQFRILGYDPHTREAPKIEAFE